jgi:glycosyltransferase involved in cell wall biosynthesis
MPEPRPYLIIVRKGPTWEPEDFEPLCRLLSERFDGELWAYGSYDADQFFGRIRLRVIKDRSSRDAVNLARFSRHFLRRVAELRAQRQTRLVFISGDPFKGGLLALCASWRTGGAFICEVNGIFGDRENVADSRGVGLQSLRLSLRRLVGAFVLRRATAVRLLFPEQLRGFAQLPPDSLVRLFFDFSNTQRFYPGPEEPLILAVGFPFRTKGFDIVCQAFRRVASRYPSWKLILIGHRVPEEVRAGNFEHPQIEPFAGMLQPDVAKWMSRCAIFALASRTEGIPRILLEAGAAAKCRLATKIGGIPAIIEHGSDGMLVESENVDEFAASLDKLMCDQDLRRKLGEEAKRRTSREFSFSSYLEHYSELIHAALEKISS